MRWLRLWIESVVRYDNEVGKGDHRHFGEDESAYDFSSVEQLVADFQRDIEGAIVFPFETIKVESTLQAA